MKIEGQEEMFGLPSRPRREGWLFKAFLIILLTACAGWIAGKGYRVVRVRLFLESAQAVQKVSHPNHFRTALGSLQASYGQVPQDSQARTAMGLAYMRASVLLPQRKTYLQSALNELNGALQATETDSPERILIQLNRCFALIDLERDTEALAALDRSESHLMALVTNMKEEVSGPPLSLIRQSLLNARAYLLAVSQDSAVRSPERALKFAQEMIAMPILDKKNTPSSRNAALLDTLAEAYFAAGQPEQALNVQHSAIALADNDGLYIYLEHFDKYRAAVNAVRK